MDVAAVDPGADFVTAIDTVLVGSGVVLAVIGPTWTSVVNACGQRRLEAPDDYVAHELAVALESGTTIIPVLVGGAAMPPSESLPPRLRALARHNALQLSDARFATDVRQLCLGISHALGVHPTDAISSLGQAGPRRFFTGAEISRARNQLRAALWIGYGATGLVFLDVAWNEFLKVASSIDRVLLVLTFALQAIFLGLWAWINVRVLAGKRWARNALVFLAGFLTISALEPAFSGSIGNLVLYLTCVASYLWVMRLVFTDPVRRWFSGT
jgi:hypothetical protein